MPHICGLDHAGTLVLTGSSDTTLTVWETNSRRSIVGVGAGSLAFSLGRRLHGHAASVTAIEVCCRHRRRTRHSHTDASSFSAESPSSKMIRERCEGPGCFFETVQGMFITPLC